ncbi:hypothetical protein ACSXDS_14840 (plasmid) [Clostridium perfringens]|uniref:Uncharacterized protein n=1 Tax=Clostridium perfringens TaxID=1502 RepID=A0AAN5NC70_CLOPF|nr:hypothetical protein [Clostridium perfringens]ELC8345892.1 hypothetical protein [Clostridium perfringens]MBO3329722.1 hypothetical protein [Clostridium perfringens]MBO3405157.1 hypothetical protein [Clostridium perfringens]MBO3408884.1 hypothetical protein [Clostridium perfringens]MBO3411920.1 hypothetical protein [Clostridium perfringens]
MAVITILAAELTPRISIYIERAKIVVLEEKIIKMN